MAHLLRIVMIHGHLNGVVELSVDGHTNICGTNASGKTTLQRLVPVFYGELPNKVVPKTRMKFDAFYLPHRNSYLVYEYRREAGNVCQAVLTRKQEGGPALSVREKMHLEDKEKSSFRGFESAINDGMKYTEKTCRADSNCHNQCKLKIYDFDGRRSIWGGECGRYELTRNNGPKKEFIQLVLTHVPNRTSCYMRMPGHYLSKL